MKMSYQCIVCDKKIDLLYPEYFEDAKEPESAMWNDGIVGRVDGGYGSRHDTCKFIISVCDDCIDKHYNECFIGNYM